MKFICTQENIAEGLSRVVPIAGRNKQLPILDHVLLQLKDGVLHLMCTDLELGVHTIVPGKVENDGSCAVSARKFIDYIQQLPTSNPITLEIKGNSLHVKTKSFQAHFPVTSDEDFPLLPPPPESNKIKLSSAVFCRSLTKVIFAAARDATRPEIHSVFIHGSGKTITIAATDSFRLVEDVINLEDDVDDFNFLLPLTTAQEVVRLFNSQSDIVMIPTDSHISFLNDAIELSSRLIDGKYPDYKQIIPKSFNLTGSVSKSEFSRALKTLAVFLPRDSRRVQVHINPSKSSMALRVGGESGEGDVDIDFEGDGDELNVLFNIQYLLDGVQYFPGDRMVIRCVGSSEAVVFVPDSEEDQYKYIVMPIQAS